MADQPKQEPAEGSGYVSLASGEEDSAGPSKTNDIVGKDNQPAGSPERARTPASQVGAVLVSRGPASPSRGRGRAPHPRSPDRPQRHAYVLHATIQERTGSGDVTDPPDYLLHGPTIRRLLLTEVPDVSEVIVLDTQPSQFLVFFGRREFNEGLTRDQAEATATRLSLGTREWLDHRVELIVDEVLVKVARQMAAQALARMRQKASGRRSGRVSRSAAPSPSPERPRGSAYATSTGEEDDDDLLLGSEPVKAAPSPVASGKGARGPRKRAARKKPKTPAAPEKAATSAEVPSRPPTREPSGYGSDSSTASSASTTRSARSRRGQRRKYYGKPTIPPLTELGKDHAGSFLIWKNIVQSHIGTVEPAILKAGVMAAIMGLPGAASVTSEDTVERMLQCLAHHYGVANNYDRTLQELYAMRQYPKEAVDRYAARVRDRVQLVHSCYPEQMPRAEIERVSKDRFFGGLRDDLRQAMAYLREGLGRYTFYEILDLVKGNEISTAPEDPPRSQGHPRRDGFTSRTHPRVRVVNPSPADDVSSSNSEAEGGGADDPEEAAFRVRVTNLVDKYEVKKRRCFQCNSEDHLVRDCPSRGNFADKFLNGQGGPTKRGARDPQTHGRSQRSPQGAKAPAP